MSTHPSASPTVTDLPDGAAHYVPARQWGIVVAPVLAIGIGYGLGRLVLTLTGGEASQTSGGAIAAVATLVGFGGGWWLLTRLNTAVFDSRGRARRQAVTDQRQAWARQHGWTFTPGPEPIDPEALPLAAPRRTDPVHAVRILHGRFRGRPASVQTWVLAGPRQWRQYRRGDGRVPFTPVLVSVIRVHTDSALPTVGLLPTRGADRRYGRPVVLDGERTRLELALGTRIASPDLTHSEIAKAIDPAFRRFDRRPVRLVASGQTVTLTVGQEPEMQVLEGYLETLSDLTDVFERLGPAEGGLPHP